jgi:hypothetical protein
MHLVATEAATVLSLCSTSAALTVKLRHVKLGLQFRQCNVSTDTYISVGGTASAERLMQKREVLLTWNKNKTKLICINAMHFYKQKCI